MFSVAGTDVQGAPYAIVGSFTANGSGGNGQGGITGGTIDLNDPALSAPVANAAISSSSYSVGVDGRGKATLNTSSPFGTIVLDFVLQDSAHGLVTEFDGNASGSGTLDVQTAANVARWHLRFHLVRNRSKQRRARIPLPRSGILRSERAAPSPAWKTLTTTVFPTPRNHSAVPWLWGQRPRRRRP